MVETLLQVAPHIKSWRNYIQKSLETIQDHCRAIATGGMTEPIP